MTDKHSVFVQQQIPVDFGVLQNDLNCLPCNVDGLTERNGYFLLMELKHGEDFSGGQFRMLKALAAVPKFTVLVVNCKRTGPNSNGARDFLPVVVEEFKGGEYSEPQVVNARSFAVRYRAWLRLPSEGSKPFICSPEDFAKDFLPGFPEHARAGALADLTAAL